MASILKHKNIDRDYHLEGACLSLRHEEKEKDGYRHDTPGDILICTCIYMIVKNLSSLYLDKKWGNFSTYKKKGDMTYTIYSHKLQEHYFGALFCLFLKNSQFSR